jgi:hypothetical protein
MDLLINIDLLESVIITSLIRRNKASGVTVRVKGTLNVVEGVAGIVMPGFKPKVWSVYVDQLV